MRDTFGAHKMIWRGSIVELDVTWGRLVHVWWALIWRNLVASLGAGVVGGLLGGIIGAVSALAGMRSSQVVFVTLPIGLAIGFVASLLGIKWLLRSKLGDFRIALVPSTALSGSASAPASGTWTVAPGWYPDPSGMGVQRWWDGRRWTDDTQGPVA
jgi:hypothetical protein